MQPAATAIVFGTFPPEMRGRAMSIYVGSGLLFLAAGPLLGGFLVERFSWHMVFLINVPIGIAGILISIAPFFFPVLMQMLGLLTGVIQAYIFAILAMVYIASATRNRAGAGAAKGDRND